MHQSKRYRVKRTFHPFTRLYIIGCIVSAIIAAVVANAICRVISTEREEQIRGEYESQITALNEQITQLTLTYEQKLSDQKTDYEDTIARMSTEITGLSDSIDRIMNVDNATFEALRKYWYIFRNAPDDSGITLDLVAYVDQKCQEYDINPDWMWHVYWVESEWNTQAKNPRSSARGLGQIITSTGVYVWEELLHHESGSYYPERAYDPFVNVEITTALLSKNLNAGGSMYAALNAYSGGGGSSYYNAVINAAENNGITLSENNVHYR